MKEQLAAAIGWLAVWLSKPLTAILAWTERTLEDGMAGPKETAARKALEDAIAKVEEWQAASDETDATELSKLTARLDGMTPANPSHMPIDGTTGLPVENPTGGTAGPAAPETSAPADNAPVTETESENISRHSDS